MGKASSEQRRRGWLRFIFRLRVLGCGVALLAGLVALVVTGWRSETRLVLEPGAVPAVLAATATLETDTLVATDHDHGRPPIMLGVAETGEVPQQLQPLLTRRYKSFAEAYRDAEDHGAAPTMLLSVDALLEKASALEEGVLLGLERLFVRGEPNARIMPLAHFLAALDQAVVEADAAQSQGPTVMALAEARAYLAVALRFVERDAPVHDEARLAEAQERFFAGRLLSEPRGLWAANERLRREFRALRALMYPLEPQAAFALRNALVHDAEQRDGQLHAHYQQWLALLEALYGRQPGTRTVADLLDRARPPEGPVSLLPIRPHEPADVLVRAADMLAGERALDEQNVRTEANIAVAGSDEDADVAAVQLALAHLMLLEATTDAPPPRANWRDMRLWARLPQLPGAMTDFSAGGRLRTSAAYKLLRLTGTGPRWHEETVRGLELFGTPLLGWRPRDTETEAALLEASPLRMEPAPEVLYRLHHTAWALPALLESAGLERAVLRRTRTIGPDGRERADSVLERLAAARDLYGALYVLEARTLDLHPKPLPEGMPSEAALARAEAWLTDGAVHRDADLARDVRHAWPLYSGADALVFYGVRGVVLHPITITIGKGTQHLALVAVTERLLYASDSHILPTQQLFRLTATHLPAKWLRAFRY